MRHAPKTTGILDDYIIRHQTPYTSGEQTITPKRHNPGTSGKPIRGNEKRYKGIYCRIPARTCQKRKRAEKRAYSGSYGVIGRHLKDAVT